MASMIVSRSVSKCCVANDATKMFSRGDHESAEQVPGPDKLLDEIAGEIAVMGLHGAQGSRDGTSESVHGIIPSASPALRMNHFPGRLKI